MIQISRGQSARVCRKENSTTKLSEGRAGLFEIHQPIAHHSIRSGIDRERATERPVEAGDNENDQPNEHRKEPREDELNAAFNLEKVSDPDDYRCANQDDTPHDRW